MMAMESIFSHPLVNSLGWALLHFVWQGTLVAILLGTALFFLRDHGASIRYGIALGALLLMLVLVITTAWMTWTALDKAPIYTVRVSHAASSKSVLQTSPSEERWLSHSMTPFENGSVSRRMKHQSWWGSWSTERFTPLLPWVVSIWLLGVLILSVRLAAGWTHIRQLRNQKLTPMMASWQDRLSALRKKVRVARPVRLLGSALVEIPTVIGWLRPMILLPMSVITGLTPPQLEAILAHELAHVRRYDYLANLLQTIVQILLFYHPAVWWMAKRIRVEREHCCDELAVAVLGDGIAYVRALANLEQLRNVPHLAMGASRGFLLHRIRRLIGKPVARSTHASRPLVGALVIFAILTVVVVAHLSSLAQAETSKITLAASEVRIADMNPHSGSGSYDYTISPDGKRVAYVAERGRRVFAVVNGSEGDEYDWIMSGTPIFSSDSKRVAYVGMRDDGLFAVIDGIEGRRYDDIGRFPLFSPDDKRIAYFALHDDKWFAVVDGAEGKRYDSVGGFAFSLSGKRFAYNAKIGDKWLAVVDGIEKEGYDSTFNPVFSPDGRRMAYVAESDGRTFVVVDGKEEEKRYDSIIFPPIFSPNSERVAYAAERNGKWFVVVDGEEGMGYDDVAMDHNTRIFSPDSKRVAYGAQREGKWLVVVDGVEGRELYNRQLNPIFSPDSKRLAYIVSRSGKAFVMLSEVHRVKRGGRMIPVIIDEPQGEGYNAIYSIAFSPDGKRFSYAVDEEGLIHVVVDGVKGKGYTGLTVNPVFSPDGKHIAYGALRDSKSIIVVDGVETEEYDWVFGSTGIAFHSTTALHTAGFRDGQVFHIEVKILEE